MTGITEATKATLPWSNSEEKKRSSLKKLH
jgi:hypothetical protein